MRRHWGFLAAAVVGLALLVTACGGGGGISEKTGVEKVIQDFVRAFNEENSALLASTLNDPIRFRDNNGASTTVTRQEYLATISNFWQDLRAHDMRLQVNIGSLSITEISAPYATADLIYEEVTYQRSTGNFLGLERNAVRFELVKKDSQWLIKEMRSPANAAGLGILRHKQ